MDGLVQIAQKVVDAVSEILPFPISLSDEKGYIIGSTLPDRIGRQHPPSIEVLHKNQMIEYDEANIIDIHNVLPGVATPLVLDNKTLGVLGIIGPPVQVKPYANLVKKYVEMTWQETIQKQTKEFRTKTLETFAQYILLNDNVNKEKIKQYSSLFHLDYDVKRYCILINIGNSLLPDISNNFQIDLFKEQLLRMVVDVFECKDNYLGTFLNTEKIILLKPVNSEFEYASSLKKFHDKGMKLIESFRSLKINDVSIAVGNISRSLEDVSNSYDEAERLIEYGLNLGITPKVYSYHDWDLVSNILPKQINNDFLDKISFNLDMFIKSENYAELANTFITYCESELNVSKTAQKLYLHRNTLIYRLKKIEEITSLDTKSFQHCVVLYVALKQDTRVLK
ncbi:CdaR family transcriptional regulator [Oceanobacillus luteolus]|uniref:CdaR family transcriptional regulator n=1 Tax=Oceanobacillus luteolus TaxID=1274358 RepID=A0ABW4HNK8_9BACI